MGKNNKYDTFYVGKVEDNKDPQKCGRLKIRVPAVHGDEAETPEIKEWADPCFPFGGYDDEGFFFVPTKKARVLVAFINGDPSKPIWMGCLHSQFYEQGFPMPPKEAYEKDDAYVFRKQIKTPSGYVLFDDSVKRMCLVHSTGSYIIFTEEGDINIKATRNINIECPGNLGIHSIKGNINVHADQYANISAENKSCGITSANGDVAIIAQAGNISSRAGLNIKGISVGGEMNFKAPVDGISMTGIESQLKMVKNQVSLSGLGSSVSMTTSGASISGLGSSISMTQDGLSMLSKGQAVQLAFE